MKNVCSLAHTDSHQWHSRGITEQVTSHTLQAFRISSLEEHMHLKKRKNVKQQGRNRNPVTIDVFHFNTWWM